MTRAPRNGVRAPAAVTLDLWYTLAYLAPSARRRYTAARRRAWERRLEASGLAGDAAGRWVRRLELAVAREERAGRSLRLGEQARWMRARTGVRVPVRPLEQEIARSLAAAPVRLAPGALGALDAMRARGVALGLVSNILHEPPGAIRHLLARVGLAERFEAVVLSCEVGAAKPSPTPFRIALKRLGVRPRNALHIGDLASDLLGARRAGIPAVRFVGLARFRPRPKVPSPAPPGPIPRVRRLDDLAARLGPIGARARAAAGATRGRSGRARPGRRSGGRVSGPGRPPTPPRSPRGRTRGPRPPPGR